MTTPPQPPPPPPPREFVPPGPLPPAAGPPPAPHAYPHQPQQHQVPPGYPPGSASAPPPLKIPAIPAEPTEYHQLLRGPQRAVWRPLVSLLLVCAGVLAASVGLLVFTMVGWALTGEDLGQFGELVLDFNNPVTFAGQNLWLAAFIPIAGLATWIAHGVRPGFVSSVAGRFRWGWFGWCLLVIIPLWLSYIVVVSVLSEGTDVVGDTAGRPSTWVALLILTLLITPFQAAGEEYLFRGWLMQQIGALIKNTYGALGLAVIVSSVVFATAHTSMDPWILLDLASLAAAAVLLTWRTGGLEAAVALHIVNNVIVLCLMILTVGLDDAFITSDTTSAPGPTLISVLATAVVTAVIWWLAGKRGIARRSRGQAPA